VCSSECAGEAWKVSEGGKSRVFLRRTCDAHGPQETCISADARFHWLTQGNPANACCGGAACWASDGVARGTLGGNAVAEPVVERLSTRSGIRFATGKLQLYLQFDGPQEAGQRALRGGALVIPITLAMTVTPENLPHLWEAVEFGLQFKHIRGVAFQPMFTSGRGGNVQSPKAKGQAVGRSVKVRRLHTAAVRRSELRDDRLPAVRAG
jgi:hypothetical protein